MSPHPIIRCSLLVYLVICLVGCGLASKKSETTVSIPNESWWNQAASSPDKKTANLAQVRDRMNRVVNFRYVLGLSPQTEINAYATKQNGQTLVIFTQGFLNEFGNDQDVLATTLGHELAHHQLGHTDPKRQKDRAFAQEVTSQTLGTIASYFIPFSGLLVGPAVKAASLGFNRDDERDADQLGAQWAMQAGYSPCGVYRFSKRMTELDQGTTLTFLSSHPGNSERGDNTQAFMRDHNQPACQN